MAMYNNCTRILGLLLGLCEAGHVTTAAAAAAEADTPPSVVSDNEIVVTGVRSGEVIGILAENELTERDIAAYGANTVGDLLSEVGEELDPSREGPVVLINGRQVSGVDEISDLPTEAVRKLQVLPARVAGRYGQRPTRRVINVVIKENHKQITADLEGGVATAGGGGTYKAELNLLRLKSGNRVSLVLRVRQVDPLFESERGIVSEPLAVPYSLGGNIVPYPTSFAEIDPALSALAGRAVTVAEVPTNGGMPGLASFLAGANRARFTDVTPFRTLAGERRTYTANGNVTQRLGKTTTLSLNVRAERTQTEARSGLASVQLRLPAGTPYSPFSRDVTVARYIGEPLRQTGAATSLEVGADLSTIIGKWNLQVSANWQHRSNQSTSELAFDPTLLQAAVAAGTVNPFGEFANSLTAPRLSLIDLRSDTALLRATVSGQVFRLPAGPVRAALTGSLALDRLSGSSEFAGAPLPTDYRRTEAAARLNLQLPLIATTAAIGSVDLDLHGAVRSISAVGTITEYGAGLTWQPSPHLDLRGSIDIDRLAPSAQTLSDPVQVNDNYRIFDFITGETVQVRYITGGNPTLPTARRRALTLGATYRPFDGTNLSLTAEYTSRRITDLQASLPPVNAQVQATFPDRFVRDAAGTLVTVDGRPVPFAYDNTDQLRWRIDYHGTLGSRDGDAGADAAFARRGGLRVNFSIEHTWTLQSVRLARAGLAEVDLLAGGASGYGGGIPRHQVKLSSSAAKGGLGLQVEGSWRSESSIQAAAAPSAADLLFASRLQLDARAFADLGTLFPSSPLLKGARIALSADNVFDSKQRVVDGSGATPVRYQPYILDPVGRTISIELRKVF